MATNVILDDSVQGKHVVNAAVKIGLITAVRDNTAYVDPDPGMTDTLKAKFGWDEVESDDYPLQASDIDRVTDDGVHIWSDL